MGEDDLDLSIELADLSMLDDETRHARCLMCVPRVGLFEPFVALCGQRVCHTYPYNLAGSMPPNPCPECTELMTEPCAEGHTVGERRKGA